MTKIELFNLVQTSAEPARTAASWQGFTIETVSLAPNDGCSYEWTSDLHFCALHDIVLKDGVVRAGDGPDVTTKDLRGTLTYVPRGTTVSGWSELTGRRNAFTAIYFEPEMMREELGKRFKGRTEANIHFCDSNVLALMTQCGRLLLGGSDDSLFAETLGLMTVLAIQKVDMHQGEGQRALPRSTLVRVREYIESDLSRSISLSDLADVARLSRFHFHRAFKSATGLTPSLFIMERRIDKAKFLLADHEMTLAQIAKATGFHDVPHLEKTFRVRVGTTLSGFRKQL